MKKFLCLFVLAILGNAVVAQTAVDKMEALLNAYANQQQLNGTVLLAKGGKVIFEKGVGLADAEKRKPNNVSSIFQVGSLTKQITAAVVMQLQEEKKLSVQDKLSKFFPQFPNSEKITIEHLLTHTSGIYNYTEDTSIVNGDLTKPFNRDSLIQTFASYKFDFEPGTDWHYSNSGYSMLGYIIEKVEKKPYERVVRERIFQPLCMRNSGFDFGRLSSANKTKGYFSLRPNPVPAPILDSTLAFAAGAVYSTVQDFYKWERAVAAGKLLTTASWSQIFTPFKNKYSYGWVIDSLYSRPLLTHTGSIPGFATIILRFPKDDLVVIAFDNSMSTKLGAVAKGLAAIALDQPYELPTEKKEIQVPVAELKNYVGEYQLAPTFSITVMLDGNNLKAQATGRPVFELFAEKENLFFLKVVDAKVEFIKDASGTVTDLILHQNGQHKGKKIK